MQTSLSVREPKEHARLMKPVANAYSLSVLAEYGPLVDDMIRKFVSRIGQEMSREVDSYVDMAQWMRACESLQCIE